MSSYIRTIQRQEDPAYVEEILGRRDLYGLLNFVPRRAHPGDHFYLAYRGRIIGRAVIDRLQPVNGIYLIGSAREPYEAKCLAWYRGGWERPPREIPVKGWQGIRYLEGRGLSHLDSEEW